MRSAEEMALASEFGSVVLLPQAIETSRDGEAFHRGGLAPWQRRALEAYIETNLAHRITLAMLSQLTRLSRFHFARAFKHTFGLSPHRYHTARRIARAKELLAMNQLSVTEIALSVGFSETSSFTAAFRRMTGLAPSAYRRVAL